MLTVDVHHHILPDFFWRETNEQHGPVGGISPPPWSRENALAFMDEAGIDVAVTSISTPGVHTGDDGRARSLARRCNELAAELVQARPDRFGAFACLPLPDVDGSFGEPLDVLKLDGVVLFSNARGVYLGDEKFDAIFGELERRRPLSSCIPRRLPIPPRMPSAFRTRSSTSWPTRHARSRTSTTATRSRGRRTSSTSSRTRGGHHPLPRVALRHRRRDGRDRRRGRARDGRRYCPPTLLGHRAVLARPRPPTPPVHR